MASFKQRGREIERSLKWLQEKVGTTHLNVCVCMCEPSRQMGPFLGGGMMMATAEEVHCNYDKLPKSVTQKPECCCVPSSQVTL